MAINTFETCEKTTSPQLLGNKVAAVSAGRFLRVSLDPSDAVAKRSRLKKKKNSPYLNGEKIQMLSRITEKRFIHRKNDLFSSFPLAANLYRASSVELKALKRHKQVRQKSKKSVLTLPNIPAPLPQSCTASDMNDNEYYNRNTNNAGRNKKGQDKSKIVHDRSKTVQDKSFEYYDRDAHHLQQLQGSSSTNIVKNHDGDEDRDLKMSKKSKDPTAQDVWAVLRNINQFQFTSPKLSEASVSTTTKKRKNFMKKTGKTTNGRRLIETCRTEEIAYVANFEIQRKDSVSPSSSFDRITVINKKDLQKIDTNRTVPKNPNTFRLNNRPMNAILPADKNFNRLRTGQYNKRLESINKYRLNANKMRQNTVKENFDSGCTITGSGSIDSSNFGRKFEVDRGSDINCQQKVLKHPNEIQEIISNINDVKNFKAMSSADRLTKGMTRMVLNDPNVMFSAKLDVLKPKPRLVTTMPSAAAMPSFTTADIKRRLAQIKFPIVVLGKDQLSSTIEVIDFDPPQFNGLNKHIWPFMVSWTKKSEAKRNNSNQKQILPAEHIANNLRKINNELNVVRKFRVSHADIKKNKLEDADIKKNKLEDDITELSPHKKARPMRQFKDNMLKLLYKKPSLNVIERTVATDDESIKLKENVVKTDIGTETTAVAVQAVLDERTNRVPKKLEELVYIGNKRPNELILSPRLSRSGKHPWARAKWASDFIENVMKKIKSGVYYCHEGKYGLNDDKVVCLAKNDERTLNTGTLVDFNDVSVQTVEVSMIINRNKHIDIQQEIEKVTNAGDPLLSVIPGFDDTLPDFEIKTLNINQIAVKHRLSNVMVQFDVSVPSKTSSHMLTGKFSTSSSCITPLSVTESQTKVFKYNTTILNAVLPAELCTVLPKVMRNIFDSDSALNFASVTDSYESISETSQLETPSSCTPVTNNNLGIVKQWKHQPWMHQLQEHQNHGNCIRGNVTIYDGGKDSINIYGTPWIANRQWIPPLKEPEYLPLNMPLVLKNYLCGIFSILGLLRSKPKPTSKIQAMNRVHLKWSENTIMRPVCTISVIPIVVDPRDLHMRLADGESSIHQTTTKSTKMVQQNSVVHCVSVSTPEYTALKPYTGKKWIPSLRDFASLLQDTWNYCKFNIHFSLPCFLTPRQMSYDKDSITVDMIIGNGKGDEEKMTVTVTSLKIDSLYSRFNNNDWKKPTNGMVTNSVLIKSIEYPGPDCISKVGKVVKPKVERVQKNVDKTETKSKRRYVKLYKKCKSTSNISNERVNTPLSKIANLDDFFQALGSAKTLSSVFDGCAGHKVMACVREMRNWIKHITPRQALLVLLLTNKQDTPNLVRLRPVLLQGISVNRITRATELDMEIEVIERENLKVSQFEGISYIPASIHNQESLLEELYWIAKTTASDYQKPFNESSERLLKSLLEKRKKLNPSYLRVMARYVGLGLLKTPVKHEKKIAV